MIQIDSMGKVFVVGKNPHLVTIIPERKDQILRINDILSIGRRDREPWMRFQVVKSTSNSIVAPSLSVKNSSSRNRNSASAASGEEPAKKKQKGLFSRGTAAAAAASSNMDGQRSSSNMSSGISRNDNKDQGNTEQQLQQASPQKSLQQQPDPSSAPKCSEKQPTQHAQMPLVRSNNQVNKADVSKSTNAQQHDSQLPEWITTTHARRNKATRSTSSLSMAPQPSNSRQQQHQAIMAKLTKAAAAADPGVAPNFDIMAPHAAASATAYSYKYQYPETEMNRAPQQPSRKRRRRTGRDTSNNSSSFGNAAGGASRGIRSAEDLFNGSRPHYPQIHLVFQDYETSARLVNGSRRDANADMSRRQPRDNRIFISKPGEGPPAATSRMSPSITESGGEKGPQQLGLLSKNFAAALLGAAAPAPTHSCVRNNHNDDSHIGGGGGVVNGETQMQPAYQEEAPLPDASHGVDNEDSLAAMAADGETRTRPHPMTISDSATCRAVLAKYTAEKEAAAAKKRESTTQAEGEETSEQRNGECRETSSNNAQDGGMNESDSPDQLNREAVR
jgi:hypothetical protein